MADIQIDNHLPPEYEMVSGSPFERTFKAIVGLKQRTPPHLEKSFIPDSLTGMTPQQIANHALVSADEWYTHELQTRKYINATRVKHEKEDLQKSGYEEIAKIIGPHLNNPEFVTKIIDRLLSRYQKATRIEEAIFEKVPLFYPFNPLELWYPELD